MAEISKEGRPQKKLENLFDKRLYKCLYKKYDFLMKKSTLINIRIDNDLKSSFQSVVTSQGFTMSEVLEAMMLDIVRKGKVPLNIRSKIYGKKPSLTTIPSVKEALELLLSEKKYVSIQSVSLFGSYAKGTATKQSDIDLFVEGDDMLKLYDIIDLQLALEKMLGKKVDIVTPNQDEYLMKLIRREGIRLYERRS